MMTSPDFHKCPIFCSWNSTTFRNCNTWENSLPWYTNTMPLKLFSYNSPGAIYIVFKQWHSSRTLTYCQYQTSLQERWLTNTIKSYRPTYPTSICSEVMKHIVFHSIMEHLQDIIDITGTYTGFTHCEHW